MSRNRIIYDVEALLAGPSPSSGWHFIDDNDAFNNGDSPLGAANYNLLFPIIRTQSISYGFNLDKTNILALGKKSTLKRCDINYPSVDLNFNYLSNGIINELRMGMYCNYHRDGSSPYYSNNTGVLVISGFLSRESGHVDDNLPSALRCRDKRNFFIPLNAEGIDINRASMNFTDPLARNFGVIALGDCQMTNYEASAAVGQFISVDVSYICDNISYSKSGSGVMIPALNPKDAKPISGKLFNIPSLYQEPGALSALRPGDITISFSNLPALTGINPIDGTGYGQVAYNSVNNIGTDINDIKIQSYNISMPLEREPLQAIGYKLPVDKILKFPIFVDLSFNAMVGDLTSGSLFDLINTNDDYNITIKCKNPASQTAGTAIAYQFIRAKFISANYQNTIGDTAKTATLNFQTEVDPESFHRGFFISGLLNINTSAYQRPMYY